MTAIGEQATVMADGRRVTGEVYHVRENGWPCVQTPSGRQASGPEAARQITARQITAELRKLLPQVQPLSTRAMLSGNGLLLGYEVTMPETAARHVGARPYPNESDALDSYLTRNLGQDVHVADGWKTRRRDYSYLTHVIIKTGRRP